MPTSDCTGLETRFTAALHLRRHLAAGSLQEVSCRVPLAQLDPACQDIEMRKKKRLRAIKNICPLLFVCVSVFS
jgi:hypothetical protein